MKARIVGLIGVLLLALVAVVGLAACGEDAATAPPHTDMDAGSESGVHIIFLHHSTGGVIWEGGVESWFEDHNAASGTDYHIERRAYPDDPYPWNNYPYDYWNLWVKHEGNKPYRDQDTLDILTQGYDVVVWKHCFPVSAVEPDDGSPQVSSEYQSLENYKLQYEALKEKMHQYPDTQFLVWTGAALTQSATDEGQAQRAQAFFDWVKGSWNEPGDNVFLWDFRQLETEGGLYLRDEYAANPDDPHPNSQFAERVAPLFAQRVVDAIEGRGDSGSLTGE